MNHLKSESVSTPEPRKSEQSGLVRNYFYKSRGWRVVLKTAPVEEGGRLIQLRLSCCRQLDVWGWAIIAWLSSWYPEDLMFCDTPRQRSSITKEVATQPGPHRLKPRAQTGSSESWSSYPPISWCLSACCIVLWSHVQLSALTPVNTSHKDLRRISRWSHQDLRTCLTMSRSDAVMMVALNVIWENWNICPSIPSRYDWLTVAITNWNISTFIEGRAVNLSLAAREMVMVSTLSFKINIFFS